MELAGDFPHATYEDWLKRVEETLKGADFDKTLTSRTYDGLAIAPLYSRETSPVAPEWPGLAPYTRGVHPAPQEPLPWAVAQAQAHPDPAEANRAIRDELANGVTALVLRVAETAGAPGLQVSTRADLARALDGVDLARIPVHLDAGARAGEAAALLAALWEERAVAPADRAGSLGLDPLGTLAATGTLPGGLDRHLGLLREALGAMIDEGAPVSVATVDTRPYHGAGASEAQELAAALATGVAYLRAADAAGLDLDAVARRVRLVTVVDADIFLTCAKLRAMRRLWARILEASGIAAAPATVAAETASRMLTRYDPWVNMLRTTAAAFAAGIGGADAITVAPYTGAIGLPDGFARRIARNIQLILREESGLGRVVDPAGGSWYVEHLTDALAEKAWALFQDIEAEGGMARALLSGRIQEQIAETRAMRQGDLARRKAAITGVSTFPKLDGEPAPVREAASPQAPESGDVAEASSFADLCAGARAGKAVALATGGEAARCEPLPAWRLAEDFEALRDAAEARRAETGVQPSVFLANLGRLADFNVRATWSRNLFGAGGLSAPANDGFADAQSAAEAFRASGAEIAAICSTDAIYADMAAETARALKAAGAKRVYLAGRPGDAAAALEEAGVDGFVHEGCDVLAVLRDAHEALALTGA
ncbi:methylmalonyl-CoA mutase family protein [Kaustia mangrovi]|uniref:methylmalonyl-CoA mutase family protein n=1 Tax=Kaustia mangrovi TaxID=2593653 RepID=UPI001BD0A174|nr:methylmalonyl-CoA mutase family protein [Kaustia mangrovi]